MINSDNSLDSSKSIEFSEISLNDDNNSNKIWLSGLECSQLSQEDIELRSESSIDFLVFSFLDRNINSNSDKSIRFVDLMDVFKNLNNLWEDNNSLNDLFENVRNFKEFLNS
jgi:hypothetical protein